MDRIRKISIFLYYVLIFVIITIPIVVLFTWWHLPYQCASSESFCYPVVNNTTLVTMFDMTWGNRLAMLAVMFIPNTIIMLNCYFLLRLFRSFYKTEIFTEKNVIYLKRIAQTLLAGFVLKPIYDVLMSYTLTWRNPAGQIMYVAGLSVSEFTTLFLSCFVFLIAWVMSEAYKLKEEQRYTV